MAWPSPEEFGDHDDADIMLTCPGCGCTSSLDEWAVTGVPDDCLACPTCDDMNGNVFIPRDEITVTFPKEVDRG